MSESGSRRAVAEIRFGEDRSAITKVGGRSIHQYWSLLAPHFRDVLLAPQRRSDDGGVSWTWRESTDKKPPTAAELAGVRKRLERANESFAENPVNPLMGDDRSGTSSQALIDQVAAKVKTMAESLAAKSDAALADFVCRTESGAMVHSWGVAAPAPIHYPDALESGLSGVVLVGGKPSEGHEVVIENAFGLSVARTHSDETGAFLFSKIAPGRYRVRVTSGKVKFPVKGVMVTVERGAMTRLELQSTSNPNEEGDSATKASEKSLSADSTGDADSTVDNGGNKWFVKIIGAVFLFLLLGGGGVWAWRSWSTSGNTEKPVATQISSLRPEEFTDGEKKSVSSGRGSGDDGELAASADGAGGAIRRPTARSTVNASRPPIAAASAAGGARSSSTIGAKVEVQSGTADVRVAEERGTGEATPPQSEASNETGNQDSPVGREVAVANARAPKATPGSRDKKTAESGVGPAITGATSRGGAAQPGAMDDVAMEITKPLPDGNKNEAPITIPKAKKAAVRQAQGAVSVGEPPVENAEAQDVVTVQGQEPESPPPEDAVTVGKTKNGLPQAKAPTVKVVVVSKGSVSSKDSDDGAASLGDGDMVSTDKEVPAARGAATKHSPKSSSAESKPTSGGSTAADDSASSSSSEQNDAQANLSTETKTEATQPNNQKPGNGANAAPSGSATSPIATVPAATKKENKPSERGKAPVPLGKSSASSLRNPSSKTKENSQVPPQAGEQETTPTSASDDPAPERSERGKVENALKIDPKTTVANIQIAGWETRLVRDVIVPTLPVREGEDDAAEAARKALALAQKARVPETLKYPATECGFVFEPMVAPSNGAFYWQDTPGMSVAKKTVNLNRAEIAWSGERLPGGTVYVLKFADGREAVRLVVEQNGNLSLKVIEGVRGSLFLGVVHAVADEAHERPGGRALRFDWQVNGVTRKTEESASDNRELRISFPLESLKVRRMEVALIDRATGWALVTGFQLQSAP